MEKAGRAKGSAAPTGSHVDGLRPEKELAAMYRLDIVLARCHVRSALSETAIRPLPGLFRRSRIIMAGQVNMFGMTRG